MREGPVTVREVVGRRDRQAFVHLPFELHRGHARWVPPLLFEERALFDPARNPAFRTCEVTLALAFLGGAPCGRIVGIVNRRQVAERGVRAARFGWLECPDEPAVARALLDHVERWAIERGMERLVGPMGFTDQDPEGLIVEGFEHEPTIATYANQPFLGPLVASCGFEKEVDYVVYKVPLGSSVPESHERISARVLARTDYRILEFRTRRQLAPHVATIIRLMNETFAELYGYVLLDEGEMKALARRFLPLLDPRFVKLGLRNGTPIGFLVAMPNIDLGLRKARGRLFPLGFIHVLRAARSSRQLDLLVGGVRAADRGRGSDVLGMTALLRAAIAAGFTCLDSHLELETNQVVRAEMERLGGGVSKRYSIYGKTLGHREAPEVRAPAVLR